MNAVSTLDKPLEKSLTSTWTKEQVAEIYNLPFLELVFKAAEVHRTHQNADEVQLCTLLSVKTGGCQEDCSYCPQAARYHTDVERQKLMDVESVLADAKHAKDSGSTRFCMGAAWREVKDNEEFDSIIDMVKGVRGMGMEACCTLGMLTENQAHRLKEAGLTAYNHNLDTSEEHYDDIISTRQYSDRLNTLKNVSKAGISVCCGGIVGLGETVEDRIDLLHTLTTLDEEPESIPINALVPVKGTPLENQDPIDVFDWIRMIACARVVFPKAMVRLSAGRLTISKEAQALAFMAGANSIFTGEKLLTTPNPDQDHDLEMLKDLGLKARPSFKSHS